MAVLALRHGPSGPLGLIEDSLQAFGIACHYVNLWRPREAEDQAEIIAAWCDEDDRCGDKREAEASIDAGAYAERMRTRAAQIFGRWCEMLVAR